MAKKRSTSTRRNASPQPPKPKSKKRLPSKPTPSRASSRTPASRTATLFQVDAFTARLFHGNPASILLLDVFPDEDTMQHIAAEHNQPMTAFVVTDPKSNGATHRIRWFTPTIEVPLCGHATLAAAHVLWNHHKNKNAKLTFKAKAGSLPVVRRDDLIVLDFPAQPIEAIPMHEGLVDALGRSPAELFRAKPGSAGPGNFMAVFDNKRDIHELSPDFAKLANLPANVAVTAPGAGHDFVSRFLHPRHGMNEDAASGSPHCMMVPYWSKRLGKKSLRAHQVSRRGGELFCTDRGPRIEIAGRAVTYLSGTITIPN